MSLGFKIMDLGFRVQDLGLFCTQNYYGHLLAINLIWEHLLPWGTNMGPEFWEVPT